MSVPSAARSRFCRLCLRKSDHFLLPLAARMDQVSVMDMLVAVIGLELEANELFPTKVCTRCMTKLDFAYSVRQEFLASAELLLKMAVEGRLLAYYEQFEEQEEHVATTRADELLVTKREILESNSSVGRSGDQDQELGPVELLYDEEVDVVYEKVEYISEGEASAMETVDEVERSEPEKVDEQPSETKPTEPKQEKYVYSWKELVKPKHVKRQRRDPGPSRRTKSDELDFPATTCYICDKEHETLEQRDEHFNEHVPMVPHRCEQCSTDVEPVISKSVLTLNRHRLMHRLPYKCGHCFRRFISSGSQYTHMWNMHMDTNSEGRTCDYCGKTFSQKRAFQAHVRRHRYKANGKFKCDDCGETCGSSLLLARHQRKHTGEKNFTCPYCDKSFSRACNLLTHKRIHTNERCHKCSDCGHSFRDSVTLRKHRERFHLGKIPAVKKDRNPYTITPEGLKEFMCKFEGCSFTTTNSTAISRHKARHNKRYECGVCGKRFAEPNLVRRHQAAIHGGSRSVEGAGEDSVDDSPLKTEPTYEVEIIDEEDGRVNVVQITT